MAVLYGRSRDEMAGNVHPRRLVASLAATALTAAAMLLTALAAIAVGSGAPFGADVPGAVRPPASDPAELPLGELVGPLDAASTLIDCGQAGARVTVSTNAHLDPGCTYPHGFDVVASDVTLDCRGARIESTTGSGHGILVRTPADLALERVTVRNCFIAGFLNNIRVTRDGFKALTLQHAYDHATADIVIQNSLLQDSHGSGLFVDGYVSDVTIADNHIIGSGSVGIYLEAGSRDNTIERNLIARNGWRESGPGGQTFELAGRIFRWWGTGREGLAIDGSRFNVVRHNTFEANEAGGVFLYKNCGEYVTERPAQHWSRVTGAEGNLIEHNLLRSERTGVWIGSRMGENQRFLDCSDPAYLSDPVTAVHLDVAPANTVRHNTLVDVALGVRVEDDDATVAHNRFTSAVGAHQAVIVGTRHRTAVLGWPVRGAQLVANDAHIAGNSHPYRWVHGQEGTTIVGNTSQGAAVGWCEGAPPPVNPFLFVIQFAPDEPGVVPTTTTTVTEAPAGCPFEQRAPASAPQPAMAAAIMAAPAFTG